MGQHGQKAREASAGGERGRRARAENETGEVAMGEREGRVSKAQENGRKGKGVPAKNDIPRTSNKLLRIEPSI